MLTIQELEALRGLVQINVNINLPKGHHMAYDKVRVPFSWKPSTVAVNNFTYRLTIGIPSGVTEFILECEQVGLQSLESADLITADLRSSTKIGNLSSGDGAANLTSILVPASMSIGPVTLTGTALSESTVDGILELLVNSFALDGVTPWQDTVDLSGGTASPPSVTGLGYKTTLEGRGATVTVNP